jgi:hypothetical protein
MGQCFTVWHNSGEDLDQIGIIMTAIPADRTLKQSIFVIRKPLALCQPHGKLAVELDFIKLTIDERWKAGKEFPVKVEWNSRKVQNAMLLATH